MTRRYHIVATLFMTAAAMALGTTANARSRAPAFMPAADVADAPSGFTEMCARDTLLCMAGMGKESRQTLRAEPIKLAYNSSPALPPAISYAMPALVRPALILQSPALTAEDELALIKTTNTQVNRAIRPMADYLTSGSSEVWSRPGRGNYLVGDCEDYAIEKRMRLIEAGFAPDKLFFSAAYIKGYGMHIVLVARLQAGDVVLDSLSPHVLAWSKVRYTWLRVQSTENPLVWHRFGNPAPAGKLAVANARGSQS